MEKVLVQDRFGNQHLLYVADAKPTPSWLVNMVGALEKAAESYVKENWPDILVRIFKPVEKKKRRWPWAAY